MQVNKSLKLLKKINSVFSTIIEDTESVSALEKELLKSYVIKFYDTLIEVEEKPATSGDQVVAGAKKTQPIPTARPDSEERRILQEPTDPIEPAKKSQAVSEEISPLTNNGKSSPQPAKISETETEVMTIQPNKDLLSRIMEEIVSSQKNSHIGERLISDLKKSMGLNDKLRYANDLFGGNQSRLLDTLETINSAPTLESVWEHLNNLAKEFEWLQSNRAGTTTKFLSLINRKFNAS